MKTLLPLALCALLFTACSRDDIHTHECAQSLIDQYKDAPPSNPPASVWQYTYNDARVFYVPATGPDQMSTLYDDCCVVMCHPDGGITGQGDGACEDFSDQRQHEKLLWQDDR